jgi:hypothetical protein
MKKLLALVIIISSFSLDSFSQQKQAMYMQITTIESVVGGGVGRSKMVITNADGTQEERDLENLFSLTGINFKNIKSNENDILNTLKNYIGKGWKLVSTVPLTLSPNQGGSGIFMTRYLLSREE